MTGVQPAGDFDAHQPVLCREVVANLLTNPAGTYVDGTFGRGGHSRAILEQLAADASLIGIDRDPQAVAAGSRLVAEDQRFHMLKGQFSALQAVLADLDVLPVDGVLLDIGVSSPQLDDPSRGFSFMADGPLDMRMDPSHGSSAADWLNIAAEADIAQVLRVHGEEKFARRIAARIVAARPLYTTLQLADAVADAVPAASRRASNKHPATRTFQAVRIHINSEHEELREGLDGAFAALKPGGRLAVITFHSLEDRVVKRRFKELSQPAPLPRRLPVRDVAATVPARTVGKPLRAGSQELIENPRARIATLRVIEKARNGGEYGEQAG